MHHLVIETHSESQTLRLGRLLADLIPSGTTVALNGTLGAGKTRLVQAIAMAQGVPCDRVVSPTFTLCNEYSGRNLIYHLDLFRVNDEDELFELGLEEYFSSDGITFVEWADRFPHALPSARIEIQIELLGATSRHFDIGTTMSDGISLLHILSERWTDGLD